MFEAYMSSAVIAHDTERSHVTIRQIIETYRKDLEEFGSLYLSENAQGKVYILNEQQTLLLVLYLDNSEAEVEFKFQIVKMFHDLRRELE